jgi:hypothetical protein
MLMADFIQHFLAQDRAPDFDFSYMRKRNSYYKAIAGHQNDGRIANNLALLGAAFEEIGLYLADVWPNWDAERNWFLWADMYELCDLMLCTVREQQPSEVFWATLCALLQHEVVTVAPPRHNENSKLNRSGKPVETCCNLVYISTELALEAVNKSLHNQGRPVVRATMSTLLSQLRRDGRLLDTDGQPVAVQSSDKVTSQPRIDGCARRCIVTSKRLLGLTEDLPPLVAPYSPAVVS